MARQVLGRLQHHYRSGTSKIMSSHVSNNLTPTPRYWCRTAALFIFCAVILAANGGHAAKLLSDIVYRTRSDQQLRLDIYTPDVTTVTCPMVLMFHGGGWSEGDKIYHGYIGPVLADMGIIAISANYRLAPAYKLSLIHI